MILGDPSRPLQPSPPPKPEMAPPVCAKCRGAMELGFVPDNTYGGIVDPKWAAGPPANGFLGIHVAGRTYTVRTYRCTQCGHLESYAPGR